MSVKIGILVERSTPLDQRTPLTPDDCAKILSDYPDVSIVVEANPDRIFTDEEYEAAGATISEDMGECDILFGMKRPPPQYLIPEKTYAFFSHTVKKQPHNRELLRQVLKRNIRLIDYECVRRSTGRRAFGSGRLAGIVGAYTGLLVYGRKFNLYEMTPAWQCEDLAGLMAETEKLSLPAIKIALTGGGRVATGAIETLTAAGVDQVSNEEFLTIAADRPVFTQIKASDYVQRKSDGGFDDTEFLMLPSMYESSFRRFAHHADMLITGHFWDPNSPKLFEIGDMMDTDFHIKVIADITCDIDGSVPCTMRDSRIESPVYDFNARLHAEAPPYGEGTVSIAAVANFSGALPKDASIRFGEEMREELLPALLGSDDDGRLARATLTEDGKLTANFSYLTDYVA